jgi:hypothetical protein
MSQRKGAAARTAVIRHVGRSSGRAYETPVDTIPAKTMRTLRLFGVNQCLHLEKT